MFVPMAATPADQLFSIPTRTAMCSTEGLSNLTYQGLYLYSHVGNCCCFVFLDAPQYIFSILKDV